MNTDHYLILRQWAEQCHCSIRHLCIKANVSRSTVELWRTGKTEPSFRTWRRLEAAVERIQSERALKE